MLKPTKKQIHDEFWFRGNLSFKFHTGQKLINENFTTTIGQLFVANVSRQFGKSFLMVCKSIEQALKNPKSQIRYATAFQTDLETFIMPTFDKVLEDCPDEIRPKFKSKGSKWVFKNGSEIKLCGLDRHPNSIRGSTLSLVVIDECAFVNNLDYIYKSVLIPATTHKPDCKIVMISTPPSTPAHPFVDYCHRAQLEDSYSMFTIYDNPMIDEHTIQRLMKESGGAESTTWRREYLCEFVTDSDLAIIPEWKDEFIQDIERDEYYEYYHKYVGLDLGVKDFTAAIFGYYDFKRAALIVEDEFMMNGPSMNTETLVGAIRAMEKKTWGINGEVPRNVPFRRISDNNWPILMQDFSSLHNLTFISTDKDNLEAMINEVRLMVQAGQLFINPRCEYLIGCLKYGVWDKNKKAFARSNVYGHFDHLAALIYLVRNLAKHTNPIPLDHRKHNHTAWLHHIKDKTKTSHNARVVKDMLMPKKKVY